MYFAVACYSLNVSIESVWIPLVSLRVEVHVILDNDVYGRSKAEKVSLVFHNKIHASSTTKFMP